MHFSSEGISGEIPFGFFQFVPETRFMIGHYLMICSLPLYIIGYIHLYMTLQKGSRKLASTVFILGIFAFMIGSVWVGSRAFIGSIVHTFQTQESSPLYKEIISNYTFYLENLVQILRVLIFALSSVFVFTILRYETLYPKWMAFFNPFLTLAVIFLLFLFIPFIGNYLLPAAMNVAHFVLFATSLLALKFNLNEKVNQ